MLLDNARLPATIIAIFVALVSRSVVMTISAGLGTIWLPAFVVPKRPSIIKMACVKYFSVEMRRPRRGVPMSDMTIT